MHLEFNKLIHRKIRIALVGCGRIAINHFNAIKHFHYDLDFVALCDSNKEVLAAFECSYDIARYTSLEQMLNSEKLDLVVLCTPSGLHAEQAVLCASFGLDVICEKPMATIS